jgi:hypothetical protein
MIETPNADKFTLVGWGMIINEWKTLDQDIKVGARAIMQGIDEGKAHCLLCHNKITKKGVHFIAAIQLMPLPQPNDLDAPCAAVPICAPCRNKPNFQDEHNKAMKALIRQVLRGEHEH